MSEFKTKFSLNDKVFIEYRGHILECRVFGVQVIEEINVISDKEKPDGIKIFKKDIEKTIYYRFYVNQYDSTGTRRSIIYQEKNVYSTKQELIENIEVESFL